MSKLERNRSLLVVIDVQQRLAAVMPDFEVVTSNIELLLFATEKLSVPVITTEQYPRGLGATVDELIAGLGDRYKPIEKTTFSCCGEDGFNATIDSSAKDQIIVVGMETHVCVLQTVLDLMYSGKQAFVVFDAVSSRNANNRDNALERMRDAGAIITSTESVVFELLERAGTPEFKEISKRIK